MENRRQALGWNRMRPIALVVACMAGGSGSAFAFEIDIGNPDVSIRWDNTVRYNVAQRVEQRDSKIGNSAVTDEGTYSFDKGDLVANRLDVLSEFDFIYKGAMGFRTSYALWYDAAYGDKNQSNPNAPLSNIPSYVGNEFSAYTKRYYHGPSGEFLDAFAFANFDAGDVPVKFKAGRHTVFWGEGLFLGGNLHGVSYAQMPLDLQKGFATPGVEAKELFRPLNQISGQAQLTDQVSVAAQYFLEWEAYRYPEGGTYLGPVDFAFNGPDRQFISPGLGFATRGKPAEPDQSGEYGLAVRWSPEFLDGTLGFYYRRYSDKLPQALLTRVGPAVSRYNLIYADGIDLYGISLAKEIGGISVGAELSYRRNTPLNAKILGVSPTGLPSDGDTPGPRGDTFHGVINGLGMIGRTPVFDAATYAAELTWSRWDRVTQGENLFFAEGYGGCTFPNGATVRNGGKWDGCSTRNYYGLGLSFTPTWYQVVAGIDLSMPMAYSVGLSGNAATVFGGNEGNGNFSIGLGADIFQKYRADLKFISYFGHYKDNGSAVTTQNGFTTLLKDRDFVSLTIKTTF